MDLPVHWTDMLAAALFFAAGFAMGGFFGAGVVLWRQDRIAARQDNDPEHEP